MAQKPRIVVTRKLPDSVELRSRKLYLDAADRAAAFERVESATFLRYRLEPGLDVLEVTLPDRGFVPHRDTVEWTVYIGNQRLNVVRR